METEGNLHYLMAMDTRAPPFDDNHVRLALKYGIDRELILKQVFSGRGYVGNDHPVGRGQRLFNKELPQRQYDPDKAKWHLQQAGLSDLTVELSSSDGAFQGAVDMALLYQSKASAGGINIDVKREPDDGYFSHVWMKKPFYFSYWFGRPTTDWILTAAYAETSDWNEAFWAHEKFNRLLAAGKAELDDYKRRQIYWDAQEILSNEGGVVIPVFANWMLAVSDKLAHGDVAGHVALDGFKLIERWWFSG